MSMTEFHFDRFDWDAGNETKSQQKHGVSKETVEGLFRNNPHFSDDPRHSGQEQRILAIGVSREGRWMVVAFTIRSKGGKRFLRPISARYMHAKEVKRYEKDNKSKA